MIYLDAGCTINKQGKTRLYEYIDMLNYAQLIISFQTPNIEKVLTTDIFEYFNFLNCEKYYRYCNNIRWYNDNQKNEKLKNIINLWNKTLEENQLLFTDYYNKNQTNYFRDDRYEQSVFSVIRKMNNPILLSDETCFFNLEMKKV